MTTAKLSPEQIAEYAAMWHEGELDHASAAKAVGLLLAHIAEVEGERDQFEGMYREQLRLKDGYKEQFRQAEAALRSRDEAVRDALRVLRRLGLNEVFEMPFAIPDSPVGRELRTRLEYARAAAERLEKIVGSK